MEPIHVDRAEYGEPRDSLRHWQEHKMHVSRLRALLERRDVVCVLATLPTSAVGAASPAGVARDCGISADRLGVILVEISEAGLWVDCRRLFWLPSSDDLAKVDAAWRGLVAGE